MSKWFKNKNSESNDGTSEESDEDSPHTEEKNTTQESNTNEEESSSVDTVGHPTGTLPLFDPTETGPLQGATGCDEEPEQPVETTEDSGEELSEQYESFRKSIEEPTNQSLTSQEFTFDEAVDYIGYGNFQKTLTMLVGMCWFADAFEVLILTILVDFIACDWNLYVWEVALMTSIMFIGMMFGAPAYGMLADIKGRKVAIKSSMLLVFVFGALCAVAPSVEFMFVLRFLVGFALGSISQGVTLCIEYYPMKQRAMAGFFINYHWSFGNVFLIVTAWLVLESNLAWRYLLFACSLPALFVFISTRYYPESTRYFLASGQYDNAVAQLKCMVAMNRSSLPEGKVLQKAQPADKKGRIDELLRSHTLQTLLLWYLWFAIGFHYYGLALMTPVIARQGTVTVSPNKSAEALGRNSTDTRGFFFATAPCRHLTSLNYLDLLWTSSAEIPGMWIFSIVIQYTYRKRLLFITVIVNAVLVLFLLIDFKSTIPGKFIFFFARANSGGIFQLIMTMTSEAFPTTLRSISMGSSHAFAMLGATLVPFAVLVLVIHNPIMAMGLLSGVMALCACAAVLLPREMKDVHIKDFSNEYKKVERNTPII